jgi:hypothetical protein
MSAGAQMKLLSCDPEAAHRFCDIYNYCVNNAGDCLVTRRWWSLDPDMAMVDFDHRVSVAPMMDWTDCRRSRFSIKTLRRSRASCLLYVSSNAKYCLRTCPGLP